MPRASETQAPTSRVRRARTGRHALSSGSVPGGHRGPRTQESATRFVPRGHVARRSTQDSCPPASTGIASMPQASGPPIMRRWTARHDPVVRSSASLFEHTRNSHPAPPIRPAGPQNESPTAGSTQAPRTATVPSLHAQRPECSRAASRGHVANSGRSTSKVGAAGCRRDESLD